MRQSCVVVGAGVFGLTAAIELARRGRAVTLLEPGPLPRPQAASTDVSKAVRSDYGADAALTDLAEQALDGWRVWNRRWDEPLFHQDGLLLLTRAPMQPGGFEYESRALHEARGRPLLSLRGAEIQRRFPAWAPGVHAEAYLNPADGWVESGRVIERLVHEARDAGVTLRTGTRVTHWLVDEGGAPRRVPTDEPLPEAPVIGVLTGDGVEQRADDVLVAAGSWTPSLLPHLAPLLATTGHPVLHLQLGDPAPWRAPRFVGWAADVTLTGWYGFGALSDGTLKLAHHGRGLPIDPEAPGTVPESVVHAARAFLAEVLPALADAPLQRTRLCPYCDSLDERFLIDADPARPGLALATGGSGHAFKFAPVLGALAADALDGLPHPLFAWREGTDAAAGAGDAARASD